MSLTRPAVILLVLLMLVTVAVRRCATEPVESLRRSRIVMGTVVEISAFGGPEADLQQAVTDAFREMERIEALMSPRRADSDVARLSQPVESLEVSAETAEVVALGLEVAAASGGAFDMGLGRLKALWDIEGEDPQVPAAAEVEAALAGTGAGALRLEGRKVFKADPKLAVDLGGIAKGFAVDRAVALLAAAGVTHATVNAGGDIRLLGDRQGEPWRIGIQHPRRPDGLLATLALSGGAVVSSGDYERFFEAGGERYHHLFDPRSGYPARACRSVTVVAPSAALADALATAAFVLGPAQGLALVEAFAGSAGLIVAADGGIHLSETLQGQVRWP